MSSINLGFEKQLWAMADKMRGRMGIKDVEYGNVVLGLIFLKYISESFEERYNILVAEGEGFEEERVAYGAENVFWVPASARWGQIKAAAKRPEIGQIIDDAMVAIEKENPILKNVLPKNYSRPEIEKVVLGELIDLFSFPIGTAEAKAQDVLGRVYEYFLGNFGSTSGEYYTPPSVVKLLVNMIEPYEGRVYDPCCGSGGMFVQSQKFVTEHQGRKDAIRVYGQESIAETWRLAKMNLAIRGIDGDLGEQNGDTFSNDQHQMLKADYILANPPFNIKDWGANRLQDDVRWKYGMPPEGNANYAWIEHIIHKLSPRGVAGFVLANGSLTTSTGAEAEIRKNIIEAGLVDCIVALPDKLFYSVSIPACLWFVSRDKPNRTDKILFIDARHMGAMISKKHRQLSDEELAQIYGTYHAWCKDEGYEDVEGFCKSATLEEVRAHEYMLTPGRYVGTIVAVDDEEPFEDKMNRLTEELAELFAKSHSLEGDIRKNMEGMGYGI